MTLHPTSAAVVKKILPPTTLIAAFAACLFCVVVGLKWATFDRFGSAMPDWDQWDAEALQLLAPWYENDHFTAHLFTPHNEHRVVLTKLQNLSLTVFNGQWDALLEAVTNALLHASLATALWLLAVRILRRSPLSPSSESYPSSQPSAFSTLLLLWLLAVALFGLPLAWQNVLGGFHSQQYWLLVLSFAAIVTLPFARSWSGAWWFGALTATLALFTMGSGLLAAAVVIVVIAFRLLRREATFRAAWPALALCAALVAAGALTRVTVYYHAHMQVKTAHDFFFSLLHSLQWPAPRGYDWLAAILWLPWMLATWRVFRERDSAISRHGQMIVALGGWVLVQLLATAYARGAGADYPASRYMDTLTFGAMVNFIALAWLYSHTTHRLNARLLAALALAWVVTFTCGARVLLDINLNNELPDAKKYYGKAEAHLRGYLATDDPAQLAFPDIPYPSAGGIIERLARPSIRNLMPAVIRAPLPLRPAGLSPFAENRASELSLATATRLGLSPATPPLASSPTWGSFASGSGLASTGEWTSAPLSSPLGAWLKFETAGQLGASPATIALELRDAQTHALLASVVPSKIPGDNWRAAYVRAPQVPFVVVARDQDPARWFAFSAPVEMGRLSYLAWRATQHAPLLVQLAAGFAASLALLAVRLRDKTPPAPRPAPAPSLPIPASPYLPFSPASVPSSAAALPRFAAASQPFSRFSIAALALGLFLFIWGAKLIAIDRYGSDLPYWDQWAKEGDYLITPWYEHHEFWKNLFIPHNEHRIAPTLALNLALIVEGGQWDARIQCVVSAGLHAAIAIGLFLWALRRFPKRWALAAGGVLGLAVAPPIAWENVLGGFQSQFYFLAGFSFLALHFLLTTPALSIRWFVGLACGLLSLVSMGSGLLVAAPLLAVLVLRLVARQPSRRDTLLTLAATLLLGALGAWLRTPTPWHDTLHAKSISEFLVYAARCLAWPLPQSPWLAPLIWLPWLALLAHRLNSLHHAPSSKPPKYSASSQSSDFLLAAGTWVLLQVAAVTFSRAGGGGLPASRYGDIAALGLIVSFLALAQLAHLSSAPQRRAFLAGGATWLALTTVCVAIATRDVISGPLPEKRKESVASERSVQAFILTDDYATFAKAPLPFPLPDWLARILRRSDIRAILPASVRAPLRVEEFSALPTAPAPALWERRTRSLLAPGGWRSAPLPTPTLAWWKFETAGPGFASPSLFLAESASPLLPIKPSRPPLPTEWRAAYVPAPRSSATLVGRTASADGFIAFTEPVEMSALSYRTWQLTQRGLWLLAVGLASLLTATAFALHRSVEPRPPQSTPAVLKQ